MAELMKGKTWKDFKHKMTYPAWVEIKHDEIRCRVLVDTTARTVQYLSYAEKPLHNMDGFDVYWLELAGITGYTEFDCGFEANGNFNDSYRWVRSSKGLPADLQDVKKHFLLYDLPQNTKPFEGRMVDRHTVSVLAASIDFDLFQPAGSWAHEEASVDQMFTVARERGYEGLMVKSLQHLYMRGKRIDGWLKVKPSEDADGQIVGFEEAVCGKDQPELGLKKGDPLGRAGAVLVHCEDGSQAAPHGIEHELAREMHEHPERFIGQWCEFKFMERDRQGGYRHPVFYRLREAKA